MSSRTMSCPQFASVSATVRNSKYNTSVKCERDTGTWRDTLAQLYVKHTFIALCPLTTSVSGVSTDYIESLIYFTHMIMPIAIHWELKTVPDLESAVHWFHLKEYDNFSHIVMCYWPLSPVHDLPKHLCLMHDSSSVCLCESSLHQSLIVNYIKVFFYRSR